MTKKILVIKHEQRDIKELTKILEDEYCFVIFEGMRKVVDVVKKEKPCIILLDIIYLPQIGTKIIEQLQKHTETKGIPIMFIVDAIDSEGQKRGIDLGADEYIAIPFVPEIIKKRIKALSDLYLIGQQKQNRKEEMIAPIKVKLLGEFTITINGISISADMNRSKKLWQMIQYLIVYRDRQITGQELIDVLWPNEEIEKPGYALKTLSYRIRKHLELLQVPYAKELIHSVDGGYVWNKEYSCEVDTDLFEEICREAENPSLSIYQKMSLWEEALRLYKGDYFIYSGLEHWMLHIQTYYYNLWMKVACNLMEQLCTEKEYDKLIEVCKRCLQKDQLNEKYQYYFIWALTQKGSIKEVIDYYGELVRLFQVELGEKPSKKIEQMYLKACMKKEKGTLTKLTAEPFFCELHIFMNLYEVEQHRMLRNKWENYTISIGFDKEEAETTTLMMKELHKALESSLRAGDVVTCVSDHEYLLLVQDISFKQCEFIIQRVAKCLKNDFSQKIRYRIEQMVSDKPLVINSKKE